MKSAWHVLTVASVGLLAGCGGPPGGGAPPHMAIPVRTATAAVEPLEERISLVASVVANETIDVLSEMDGVVEEIGFEEGQPVAAGQMLFQIDRRKLEANLAQAEANFNLAEANWKRAQSMLEANTISRQEYDQAAASQAAGKANLEFVRQQLRDSLIAAPFGAMAGARHVSRGQVITRNTLLTHLVDLDPVKLEVRVPERFLGDLAIGQDIAFRVPAYPGESFSGKVFFVDPQVDPSTRTVLVKATHENPEGRLRPGMFGNLDLILRTKPRAVMVPEKALLHEGDASYLFTVEADGTGRRVVVTTGLRLPGRVEILTGLQGGEQVVVEGIQKVHPGAPLAAQPLEAAAPAGTAGGGEG